MYLAIHECDHGETFIALAHGREALRRKIVKLATQKWIEVLMPPDVQQSVQDCFAMGCDAEARALLDCYMPLVNERVRDFFMCLRVERV